MNEKKIPSFFSSQKRVTLKVKKTLEKKNVNRCLLFQKSEEKISKENVKNEGQFVGLGKKSSRVRR